jgi:hypothetical protein
MFPSHICNLFSFVQNQSATSNVGSPQMRIRQPTNTSSQLRLSECLFVSSLVDFRLCGCELVSWWTCGLMNLWSCGFMCCELVNLWSYLSISTLCDDYCAICDTCDGYCDICDACNGCCDIYDACDEYCLRVVHLTRMCKNAEFQGQNTRRIHLVLWPCHSVKP